MKNLYLSMIAGLPVLAAFILISIYSAPIVRGPDLANDFKSYYLALVHDDPAAEEFYKQKIYEAVEFRLHPNPNDPVARFMWVGLFSGNEDVALVSGVVHFDYLIQQKKATNLTILLTALILTSSLLVFVAMTGHNLLTFLFRLDLSPTRAYLEYFGDFSEELDLGRSNNVSLTGQYKALLGFFPGWLIGLLIGIVLGDYSLYLQNPLGSAYLFVSAHLFFTCAGAILVVIAQSIICFALMKQNISIVDSYLDEIIGAIAGILIVSFLFDNGLATTVAVTAAVLLYTFIGNSSIRHRKRSIRVSMNGTTAQDYIYENTKFNFSLTIPAGWKRTGLDRQFAATGGQLAILSPHANAKLNVAVGQLGNPEWVDQEARARAIHQHLLLAPTQNREIQVRTPKEIAGEPNCVQAEYIGDWSALGGPEQGRSGLISMFHNDLEYAIQWVSEPDCEQVIYGIIDSFGFLNKSLTNPA